MDERSDPADEMFDAGPPPAEAAASGDVRPELAGDPGGADELPGFLPAPEDTEPAPVSSPEPARCPLPDTDVGASSGRALADEGAAPIDRPGSSGSLHVRRPVRAVATRAVVGSEPGSGGKVPFMLARAADIDSASPPAKTLAEPEKAATVAASNVATTIPPQALPLKRRKNTSDGAIRAHVALAVETTTFAQGSTVL